MTKHITFSMSSSAYGPLTAAAIKQSVGLRKNRNNGKCKKNIQVIWKCHIDHDGGIWCGSMFCKQTIRWANIASTLGTLHRPWHITGVSFCHKNTRFYCDCCCNDTVMSIGWYTQQIQNICIIFIQRRLNVFDVGPTLNKCYTNVLCLLGSRVKANKNNCLLCK